MRNKQLSLKEFNLMIGLFLLYGAGVTALGIKFLTPIFKNWNVWGLLLGYILAVVVGTVIAFKSDKPVVSFIGYSNALLITIGVIVVMMIAAYLKPTFFLKLGRVLMLALVALIVIELVCLAFGLMEPKLIDVIAAGLFALFIGWDWAKAQQSEITLDGAIDSCVSLYIDGVNLFLRTAGLLENDD